MTLDEFKQLILSSSREDWTHISCWGCGSAPSYRQAISVWTKGGDEFAGIDEKSHAEVLSLKSNLLVSIAYGLSCNDNFSEPWTNSFPDSKASSSYVDFFYSNQLVYRDLCVSVDGGRCYIPIPEIKEKSYVVSREKYQVFELLNSSADNYEDYFKKTGIQIIDKPWMV
jgi:hypothetical protein